MLFEFIDIFDYINIVSAALEHISALVRRYNGVSESHDGSPLHMDTVELN